MIFVHNSIAIGLCGTGIGPSRGT